MRHAMRAAVLATALTLLPVVAQAQQPDPPAMARGGQLYGQTCARCHNLRPATERSDREWATIMLHMRARANLTKADTEAILVFLQATNGDDRRAAAPNPSQSSGLAASGSPAAPFLTRPDDHGEEASAGGLDASLARALADYLNRLRLP